MSNRTSTDMETQVPKTPTRFLSLRAREAQPRTKDDFSKEQILEVLDGETVVGQLAATRVVYELRPGQLGKLSIELIVKRAEVGTHQP